MHEYAARKGRNYCKYRNDALQKSHNNQLFITDHINK